MVEQNYDLVIFEDAGYVNLMPLVYWREVGDLRCGCFTLQERIYRTQNIDSPILYVRPDLRDVVCERDSVTVQSSLATPRQTLFVNARAFLSEPINPPASPTVARNGDQVVFVWADASLAQSLTADTFLDPKKLERALGNLPSQKCDIGLINYPWDLIEHNSAAIELDWKNAFGPANQGNLHQAAHLIDPENISIGKDSSVGPCCVIDASDGPVIIGQNVTVKPNCTLQGPLFIGDGTVIQPAAVIGPGNAIGPQCRIGGEVENSIIHSFSNKRHDGYLGHSVLAQWVNLGAATTTSNLKHTYGPIRVPINGRSVDSGKMFVGLTIGDHAKIGINTAFRTGAVVGFAANFFAPNMPPQFLPSFSWVADKGSQPANPDKLLDVAQSVMARRNVRLTGVQKKLFLKIPQIAESIESSDF